MTRMHQMIAVLAEAALVLVLQDGVGRADSLVVQGQNAVGIYDAKFYQNYNDVNFGGSQSLTMLNSSGLSRRSLFKFTNIDTIGSGQVVDSLAIDLYCTSQSGATVGMFELWKDWYEGSSDNAIEPGAVDDVHWHHGDSSWTKELADSANDAGSQNRGNGTGADRKATAMASVTVTSSSVWHRFRINSELAQDWYDGTKQPYGVLLLETSTVGTTAFASSEYATVLYRPKVTIYFHAVASETPSRRRQLIISHN